MGQAIAAKFVNAFFYTLVSGGMFLQLPPIKSLIEADEVDNQFITILVSALTIYTVFNKKVREFLLRKFTWNKTKAAMTGDIVESDDKSIGILKKRVNEMVGEMDKLFDTTSDLQRENHELRSTIMDRDSTITELQNSLAAYKKKGDD